MYSLLLTILLIAQIAILLPSLYLLFLTVVGLLYRPARRPQPAPGSRFAILIPAHNEELLLPKLLESLREIEYPREMFDVYVVADNCSDSTAEAARDCGATVLERQDSDRLGKGYALRWLLQQLHQFDEEYDVYLFLDADTLVSPNFLSVMDSYFQSGSSVVQSYYAVSNSAQTSVSALRSIALVLMHYVRPRGRQALGLSCGLFGNGMGFKRDVVDRYGWDSFTLAEDVEHYLKLTEHGVKVDFAPDALLWAQMPATLKDARSQNLRWERGRLQMVWRYGFRFFLEGLLKRNLAKLDAAIEMLIPPLSITFAIALAFLLLSIPTGRLPLIALGAAANLALFGHVILGLFSAHTPFQVYRSLAFAPWFILWKLLVYAQAMMPGRMQWIRTERS